jgi:[ribosomal protein S5]-alanine N-acetyltransferase
MALTLALRLETSRLVLRPAHAAMIPALVACLRRNQAHLAPWEPMRDGGAGSLARVATLVERDRRLWRHDQQYALIVTARAGGAPIGRVSFSGVHRGGHQGAFVGYWIDAAEEGKGLASEALDAALGFAFYTAKLHRIQAAIMPHNVRSLALIRRIGFREEGLAKGYLNIDGAWRDHLLFAKLAEEHAPQLG